MYVHLLLGSIGSILKLQGEDQYHEKINKAPQGIVWLVNFDNINFVLCSVNFLLDSFSFLGGGGAGHTEYDHEAVFYKQYLIMWQG